MAQARVELAFILYFAKIYTVLFTLMELGLFIYKVSLYYDYYRKIFIVGPTLYSGSFADLFNITNCNRCAFDSLFFHD